MGAFVACMIAILGIVVLALIILSIWMWVYFRHNAVKISWSLFMNLYQLDSSNWHLDEISLRYDGNRESYFVYFNYLTYITKYLVLIIQNKMREEKQEKAHTLTRLLEDMQKQIDKERKKSCGR